MHAYFKLMTPIYLVSLVSASSLLIFFLLGDFGKLRLLALPIFFLGLLLRNPVPYLFLLLALIYLFSRNSILLKTVIILSPLALVEGLGIGLRGLSLELTILFTLFFFFIVSRYSARLEEDKTKNIQIKPITKTILYISLILLLLSFSTIDPFAFACQKNGKVAVDGYHHELASAFFENDTLIHSTLRYLRSIGYEPVILDKPLTPDTLGDISVLIIETPENEFTAGEIEAITEFVEKGGGLYVLGDHTNIYHCYLNLNPLLHKFGLHLNFDYSMLWEPHFASLAGFDSVEETAGATLRINRMDALVFYSLKYTTWADLGDWQASHHVYMGDVMPEKNEDHGVLPICAAVNYHKGRVVAIANSDSLSGSNLLYNYDFIHRVIKYLDHENSFFKDAWFRLLLLALILFGIVRARSLALKPFVFSFAIVLILVQIQAVVPVGVMPENTIALDVGHANVEGYGSPHQYKNVFLAIFAQHYGFNPVLVQDVPKDIQRYKAYVTMGPRLPFNEDEVNRLRKYVENGGFLIVCDGYHHLETPKNRTNDAANSLLRNFDISLRGELLGEVSYFKNTTWNYAPAYRIETKIEAKPIDNLLMQDVEGNITLYSAVEVEGGTPIALYNSIPVIAVKNIGNGKLLVVGDHTLFKNFVKYEPVFSYPDPNLKRFIENIFVFLGGKEEDGI